MYEKIRLLNTFKMDRLNLNDGILKTLVRLDFISSEELKNLRYSGIENIEKLVQEKTSYKLLWDFDGYDGFMTSYKVIKEPCQIALNEFKTRLTTDTNVTMFTNYVSPMHLLFECLECEESIIVNISTLEYYVFNPKNNKDLILLKQAIDFSDRLIESNKDELDLIDDVMDFMCVYYDYYINDERYIHRDDVMEGIKYEIENDMHDDTLSFIHERITNIKDINRNWFMSDYDGYLYNIDKKSCHDLLDNYIDSYLSIILAI